MRAAARRLLSTGRTAALENASGYVEALAPSGMRLPLCLGAPAAPQLRLNTGTAAEAPSDVAAPDQQGGRPAAAPPGSAAAAATTTPAEKPKKYQPPYRIHRRPGYAELDDRVVSFAERMFAADLDAEPEEGPAGEEQAEQAAAAAGSQDVGPSPISSRPSGSQLGLDEAATAHVLEDFAQKESARRRRGKQLTLVTAMHKQAFDAWREEHSAGIEQLRAAVTRLGMGQELADVLVQFLFASKDAARMYPSEQDPSRPLVALDLEEARQLLCGQLGLPSAIVPALLRRCPRLLVHRPSDETLQALQDVLGGRMELAEAVQLHPGLLHSNAARLKRRIELLALHMHCSEMHAAIAAAQLPALLDRPEETIAGNARFLGSLLPIRPYATLVGRFPELLTGKLQSRLRALQQRAPPELAAVDVTLLASQQPTLLLEPTLSVLATWRRLNAVCEGVPAWCNELAGITQPSLSLQQQEEQREAEAAAAAAAAEQAAAKAATAAAEAAAAAAAKEAEKGDSVDSWFAEVYGSAGRGAAAPAAKTGPAAADPAAAEPAAKAQADARPFWFYRDAEADVAAATPGAFGTMRRPWQEGDRVRVRQLARLLSARRWQLARLDFLAEEVPEEAGKQGLLDVVMAPKATWEARHPSFPGWLMKQREKEVEEQVARKLEREQRRAEERAAAEAAAAGEGPGVLEAAAAPENPAQPAVAAADEAAVGSDVQGTAAL